MASPHVTDPLTTHTYTGMNGPDLGSLIKLRCSGPLQGPGSMNSLQESVRSNTKSPPHSVLVVALRGLGQPDYALEIDYFPAPSYHRSPDPVADMAKASEYDKLIHVPLPSATNVPTPASFGNPLTIGDYTNDRPCWIQVRRGTVKLAVGQKWKSFQPEVIFPGQEFMRLLQYEQYICTRGASAALVPEPPSHGRFLDNPINITQDDESSDWDYEPLYESPADFFRTLPKEQRNEEMELSIQQDEARKKQLADDRVRKWVLFE